MTVAGYLRWSVVVAAATILLKTGAWWLTGSVGLLSDALESVVNLAGATMALAMVTLAAQPPDAEHPYGHHKAEYFSAGFEGILIFVAALGIVWTAVQRLIHPQPLEQLSWGLGLSLASTALNGGLSLAMRRKAREARSASLAGNARHLMTDVWTSLGIIGGLVAVAATGYLWLDPVIALAVGAHIARDGWRLVADSAHGLMDAALPAADQEAIAAVLARHAAHDVVFDHVATRQAGGRHYADLHIHVPGNWTLHRAARLRRSLEADLMAAVPGLHPTLQLLPVGDEPAWQQDEAQ